jgi:nitronate monooxygenase
MPVPPGLKGRLRLPAMAAPMFLVSGPELVVQACKSGLVGTFPALNQRTSDGFAEWLELIEEHLDGNEAAPFGVNLIVHRSNGRLDADLKIAVDHKVPLIITSLGAVSEVVDAVHTYGGLVFHDVINLRHAEKAAAAGVDGLIAVAAGAGGHAGTLSPFAFLAELRSLFAGALVLSGAIGTGAQIAAALMMGADLAYVGTRFIATRESLAQPEQKAMILEARAKDIIYTPAISGVSGNFLRQSIEAAGLDPANLPAAGKIEVGGGHEKRAWKNIWSAGHGVGGISDIPTTAELCARLLSEFREATSSTALRGLFDQQQ